MSDARLAAPEILEGLQAKVSTKVQKQFGLPAAQADEFGLEVAMEMAEDWGGQLIYFPQGRYYKISERDQQLYDKFTGDNHADLVREFGVSLTHVYRVIKVMRAKDIARRQQGLFPDESSES